MNELLLPTALAGLVVLLPSIGWWRERRRAVRRLDELAESLRKFDGRRVIVEVVDGKTFVRCGCRRCREAWAEALVQRTVAKMKTETRVRT